MLERHLVIEDVSDPRSGSHILRLSGPLILSTLDEFQSRVRSLVSNDLILDFTNVSYVDSAGIGALVGIYVRHQRDEYGVSLINVNDRVRATLKIAHIEQFFRFFDNVPVVEAKRATG
jgi:anti-sigma B factor antagonist